MTFGVFLAVISAALLHACWNAAIKTGPNKQASMLIMTTLQGLIGLCLALFLPFPPREVWPWIIGSGLVHMAYQLLLAYAYEQGDLSRVYPISRGSAPLMVLAFSVVALPELVSGFEYLGVAVLGCGVVLMARGAFRSGESRRLVPYALAAATTTAAYSVIDGLGARISGTPVVYVGWLLLVAAVFYVPVALAVRGPGVLIAPRRSWLLGFFAATASYAAYAIAVWAMTKAPIALVAALRETSILFAVLIGWLVFGERMDRSKAIATGLIVLGVILTRL